MPHIIKIVKASGEMEAFSEDKLRNSLSRSGAENKEIEDIIKRVSSELYSGISTKEIYRLAKKLLKSNSAHLAARYQLKQAIMELGPSGYPFEKFIGDLLKDQGYSVRVGEIVNGKCVNHEIDVIAEKDHHHFMIECKYHNQHGISSNVKIPLYVQARFKDVEAAWELIPGHSTKFHQGWVITNTRFSTDAIAYGNCAGLKMLGWNYPHKDGLKELIDRLGLYPITCLTSITRAEKQRLIDMKVVLCRDVCHHEKYLLQAGVSQARIKGILTEGNQLCHNLTAIGHH